MPKGKRIIRNRRELFDYLQSQMQTAYRDLRESQRLEYENTLVKTYILEAHLPEESSAECTKEFIHDQFLPRDESSKIQVLSTDERGFFEIRLESERRKLALFVDCATNSRYWLGYSLSISKDVDWWLDTVIRRGSSIDRTWLWPSFLESIQARGMPRGFGLDYDYRKLDSPSDSDKTTYLKMQLWGGEDTKELYDLLRGHQGFGNRVVLSKVRLREVGNGGDGEDFALQDVRFDGKCTVRGTDFSTHALTLDHIRSSYEERIDYIESCIALSWKMKESGRMWLEGHAINFITDGFVIPIERFCETALNGSSEFGLIGFPSYINRNHAVVDAVDVHSGGCLALEIFPDMITVYLPEGTCGNTIARLYTNLQHFLCATFVVEVDDGNKLF